MKIKRHHRRIIIDCNYLGYMAEYAMDKRLETSTGIKTNVIYGFLNAISGIKNSYPDLDFIFTWDSRKSLRKEQYAGYKESRHKDMTPEERETRKSTYRQFGILRKRILPRMGFRNNFMVDGYEGDDLIASIVKNDDSGMEYVIYASDHDLYQLLSPDVKMLKKNKLYTAEDFVEEFGISPSEWWRVKAIAGCSSDEVPGIKGVGEKTVCKYLKRKLNEKSKTYQKIVDGLQEVEERNIPLVRLPFEGTPVLEIADDDFNPEKIRELFEYFEFESFLDDWQSWEVFWK